MHAVSLAALEYPLASCKASQALGMGDPMVSALDRPNLADCMCWVETACSNQLGAVRLGLVSVRVALFPVQSDAFCRAVTGEGLWSLPCS